ESRYLDCYLTIMCHLKTIAPIRLALFLLLFAAGLAARPAAAQVTISEFLTSNHSGLIVDQDGDTSDWIELYNDGSTPANITGWHLTDDTNDLTRWTFPLTTIGAKS